MIWYALLIPAVLSIIAYVIWSKKFAIWEIVLPTAVSLVAIFVSYEALKTTSMRDVEYNGYVIVEARYYEAYTTWVKKTCYYTTCSGSGKSQHCTTHSYDCSYCDYHAPYWEAIDDNGNRFAITEAKYKQLIAKWKASPKFIELNRHIVKHGSCGKDGDMYAIYWNFDIKTSECSVLEVPFQNIVKVSHSAFQYPTISDEEAAKIGLYKYPKMYDFYKQPAILGLDSFRTMYRYNKDAIQTKFEYLNGYMGPKNKVKVFTLLFKNKPIDVAFKQEAYWDGGNQNEVVVCIGLDDKLNIQWVKPFSWCDNKRIIVDTREDIAELKNFDPDKIFVIYYHNVSNFFHYKSFKDFNYLTFEPTTNQLLFVYILTIVISLLVLWWCIKNDIE